MSVSTKTEYALRALLEIPDKSSISAQSICDKQNLPKKYTEQLLRSLKKAGLVVSSPGALGGYTLARPASRITLLDIMDAVEDRNAEMNCARDKQFCLGDDCGLQAVFNELAKKQRGLFRGYSLANIIKDLKQEKQ
ncbi:MAG: Rrf2 family transcriptional regulator [Candidatus Cloacimonadaceae bacterium]|jgi:Rrf2 family protein|nr:Rrf2 family transcriptional regulator [Candidatus Cloacimonadota bacterium]MDX9950015.1 Rrf2 family transcriptional regulator [Candidatus Syntrophosphaera sp.]NLN85651.1 Rrf2 family transcriptional regulator [Candidatus Cloacimonadota bacterium]